MDISRPPRLPLAPIYRKIKQTVGPECRLSKDAYRLLREYLHHEIEFIALKAWRVAKHSGRKTIMAKDIKLAIEEFRLMPLSSIDLGIPVEEEEDIVLDTGFVELDTEKSEEEIEIEVVEEKKKELFLKNFDKEVEEVKIASRLRKMDI